MAAVRHRVLLAVRHPMMAAVRHRVLLAVRHPMMAAAVRHPTLRTVRCYVVLPAVLYTRLLPVR
jgi:hypothetical protein